MSMRSIRRGRRLAALLFAALAALAAAGSSAAADASSRRYAVISLIGDRLLVVGDRASTESAFDVNLRETREIADDVFDRVALLAADRALKALQPGQNPTLLAVRSPRLFALQNESRDATIPLRPLVDSLRGALAGHDVSHLVLVSKHRAFGSFGAGLGYLGHGQIEGLGYFIERRTPTVQPGAQAAALGFVAPFAYFKVSLIDVSTLAILREEPVREEHLVSAARAADGGHPWDALTSEEKVRLLRSLIERGIARAVPAAVRAP